MTIVLREVRCPNCRQLTPWEGNRHRPFCSARCKLRDFGNWAAERYRIPGPPGDGPAPPAESDDDEPQ